MNLNHSNLLPNRRHFLRRLSLGAALFTVPGAFAEELVRTPRQTEGPFYPDHLPLDTDNDLIIVNDGITPAVGEITHLNGRILDASGEYYFRTIKPVLYPGRTRHIHFAIKMKGREKWTTQCYVKGEPQNERDGIYKQIADAKARASVTVDFAPIKGSRIGELAARFDIVMGFTPEA